MSTTNLSSSFYAAFCFPKKHQLCHEISVSPGHSATSPDWIKTSLCIISYMLVSAALYICISSGYFASVPLKVLPLSEQLGLMFNWGFLLAFILIPAILYFEQADQAETDNKKLEVLTRSNMLLRLNVLQTQINPHFLFNSLHVLSMGTQDAWVKAYVIKLSNLYRYVLNSSTGSPTSSIADEIEFARNYIHIISERFENRLELNIELSEEAIHKRIPVLSLHILLENVVKHNDITLPLPLNIHVYQEQSYLVITNNRHTKNKKHYWQPTKIGLKNLAERYDILMHTSIIVSESPNDFTVKIPMI
jgi:two-component system LytT family sensor kinase